MGIDAGYIPIQSMLTIGVLTDFLGILLDWKRLTIDLLPPHSSRLLWTFPTYSMPDIAFFTFILTVSSRGKARESGRLAADATAGPDGYFPLEVVS